MSSTINADTTDGVLITSDLSGELKLQSAGTDIVTVSSTGIAMGSGKTLPASALTGTLPAIDGSNLTNLPAGGKILQVVQGTKTSAFTSSSTSWTTVTGLSASITPSSTSSKILVMCSVPYSNHSNTAFIRLTRGGTVLLQGDSAGSRTRAMAASNDWGSEVNADVFSYTYLDSPATTSSITYYPQVKSDAGTTIGVNRTQQDNDNGAYGRFCSTVTLMEIGA